MEILRRLLTLIVLLSQSEITYGVEKVLKHRRRDRRIKAEPNPSFESRSGGVPFFTTLRESMTSNVDAGVRASCLALCDKHEFREKTPKFTFTHRIRVPLRHHLRAQRATTLRFRSLLNFPVAMMMGATNVNQHVV